MQVSPVCPECLKCHHRNPSDTPACHLGEELHVKAQAMSEADCADSAHGGGRLTPVRSSQATSESRLVPGRRLQKSEAAREAGRLHSQASGLATRLDRCANEGEQNEEETMRKLALIGAAA